MEAGSHVSARQFRSEDGGVAGGGNGSGQDASSRPPNQLAVGAAGFGAWLYGATMGGGEAKRDSGRSQASEDADWEVVQDAAHAGGDYDDEVSTGLGLVVRSAGEWAHWSYHGAAIGVEKALDGIRGVWHFKRLKAERQEALSLASRQQWSLMDLEHQRRREREVAAEAEAARASQLQAQVRCTLPGSVVSHVLHQQLAAPLWRKVAAPGFDCLWMAGRVHADGASGRNSRS